MNIRLTCSRETGMAAEAERILRERVPLSGGGAEPLMLHVLYREEALDGYGLELYEDEQSGGVKAVVGASVPRNFIAGTGELLSRLLAATDSGTADGAGGNSAEIRLSGEAAGGLALGRWEKRADVQERIHYMPGHFGNSFEVCWSGEMQRCLEDLALAGASGYGDWFDPNDMPDPYHSHVYHSTSMFLWNRKKEWLTISQRLGLDNVLVITPNVGFVDQMRPEWVGVRDHAKQVQGQVLCPSNSAARKVILNNHSQLFADLKASGIKIQKVVYAPYDDGGCACERCQPYYPVFLQLVRDVQVIIRSFFPEVQADICGWWTSPEEREQLAQFVEGEAKSWFGSFQYSAAYDVYALLPDLRAVMGERMALGCFLHIGFSRDRRDVYIKSGIHSAGERMQSVIRSFASQRCTGFMTYNESFGDHFNAFVASRLGYRMEEDLHDIVSFYGRLILGLRGASLHKLVGVLLEMEGLDASRAAGWERALEEIRTDVRVSPVQPWAFEHIVLKARLMALDEGIERQLDNGIELEHALPDMERRLLLSEQLWRQVYGFGVLRHILIPDRMLPEWYGKYKAHKARDGGLLRSGAMHKDA
ncbi:hypothetical protein M6D81_08190 [Paenibacillus sp. J5C_2022]|uniref:hypothetical protein n=1 Tax=Paenibacillus sp. J5C2022 TaxID=2977129 RepID=UPI0021CE0F2B|nr:hypothetical protein [Paenibacillus sp. J5C2022]MCU6708696.1 hypothetical protein [Paenibacillus sp. J5C2022]